MPEISQSSKSEQIDSLNKIIVGVAHELNNPNAFIRLSAVNLRKMFTLLQPLLYKMAKEDPSLKIGKFSLDEFQGRMIQQIESILEASVRIITVADKLKIATTHSLMEKADIRIDHLLQGTLEAHQFLYKGRVRFELLVDPPDLDTQKLIISGHHLNLEQAFSILITNACDAMRDKFAKYEASEVDPPGRLQIKIENHGEETILKISDNGDGIPESHLKKIFDPYFSTKKDGRGEGLGLTIFRTIMENHNIKIEVDSQVSQGTVFTLTIQRSGSGK